MLEWESSERQLEGFSAQLVPGDTGQCSLGRLAGWHSTGWHQGVFKSLYFFVASPAFPMAFL